MREKESAADLSHLVSALAASDVDDGVGVGVLGERLRDHSLAAAERALAAQTNNSSTLGPVV